MLWAQDSAMVSVDSLKTTVTVQTDSIVAATRPLPAPMMTADCKPVLRPKDVLVPVVIQDWLRCMFRTMVGLRNRSARFRKGCRLREGII